MGVSAIVAAFNEEETIAEVLDVLTHNPLIDEVIVVSDGSTDRTVEIARSFREVRTINLLENQGKGYAMRLGVEHASFDVLFFVDGDMLNLTNHHIESLVQPVLASKCDMNVGIRNRGAFKNYFHLKLHFGPVLSGIRVMRREVFQAVPLRYMERFKIEAALNFFCVEHGFRQQNTVIYDLGHVIKETKRGVIRGLAARGLMTREVTLLHFDLYFFQAWRWIEPQERQTSEYELYEAKAYD